MNYVLRPDRLSGAVSFITQVFQFQSDRVALSEPLALPRRSPTIWSLIAISMISPMAITVIVPSMPGLQAAFDADYATVQLTLSLYLAAISIAQPFVGLLSDRFGRRPVLLIGLGIFVAASLLAAVANNIETIIALRTLQGMGGCTGMVLARAIIRDLYERRRAASMIGYVTMAFAVAPMVAPFLGGLLQEEFGWSAIYWFLGLFGLACLVLAWFDVSETNADPSNHLNVGTMLRDFGALLAEPGFRLFAAVAALSSATFFAFIGGAPFVSEFILELSPTTYGAWFALTALGYSTGNFISARFAERVGITRLMIAGAALLVAPSLLLMALFGAGFASAPSLFIPMFFIGTANGLCMPSAIAGAVSVRPDIAGAASGLTGSLQTGIGAAVSALTGAILAGGMSALPLFYVMTIAGAMALGTALLIKRSGL
jgi:DHA1 family bicyclomycin/chloramphenicol resistance-like MFS transporter